MFLTVLAAVKVPKDEDNNWESGALRIFYCIWIMHLGTFLTIVLNNHNSEHALGLGKATLNTCMMLFQVVVLIYVNVNWVFPDEDVGQTEEIEIAEAGELEIEVEGVMEQDV